MMTAGLADTKGDNMPATPKRRGREAKPGSVFIADVLAGNVRSVRQRKQLKQGDLAERMNVLGHSNWSRATVSEVERGGRTVSFPEFVALAIALGASPAELMWPDRQMWRDRQRIDLGIDQAEPVHPNFIAHWLMARYRIEVDMDDPSRFILDLPNPTEDRTPEPATAEEIVEFFGEENVTYVEEG